MSDATRVSTAVNALSFRCELITEPEHFIDFFTAIYKFFCGPIRSFYILKEHIFLPFHILQLVESATFIFLKPEKGTFFGWPARIGYYVENPSPPTVDPGF